MISVTFEITDKGKRKLYNKAYNQVKSQLVKQVGDEMYDYITSGGSGVRKQGYNPIGGAPVWEDDPNLLQDGQTVGELRDSHTKSHTDDTYKIGSTSPYVLYVIFGYRSLFWQVARGSLPTASPPKENPYHKRTVDETIKDGVIEDNFIDAMVDKGLI